MVKKPCVPGSSVNAVILFMPKDIGAVGAPKSKTMIPGNAQAHNKSKC